MTAPYSPADAIRDLVDAVQSFWVADRADCCWVQEPGELHWSLVCRDGEFELEILRFAETIVPGRHRGDAESVFKSQGKWFPFARQLLSSLDGKPTNRAPTVFGRFRDQLLQFRVL